MIEPVTRRQFIHIAGLGSGLALLGGVHSSVAAKLSNSLQNKLNIACIGVGGEGAADINYFTDENIVALCDVDDVMAAASIKRFPEARRYRDFRRMLDDKTLNIDAVCVSTPDHVHAVAATAAMALGKHVYCQKPLAHTPQECRAMLAAARKHKVVTQMGTQGHAYEGNIRAVELLRSGIIGDVTEVHVVTDRPIWPQGLDRPKLSARVPATLKWDLWLGPAPARPYSPVYLPFVWRGWWDFGTGALGDMACHLMDVAFWALNLRYPIAVEASGSPRKPESGPLKCVIRYEFPKRGALPPVTVTWYDGGNVPAPDVQQGAGIAKGFNGSLYIGSKGRLLLSHGGSPQLLPRKTFDGNEGPARSLPRPKDHYQQWIDACKSGGPTGSNFAYAAPMTESILLGNIAFRLGKRIEYDSVHMKARGCPEADSLLHCHMRKGWELAI